MQKLIGETLMVQFLWEPMDTACIHNWCN